MTIMDGKAVAQGWKQDMRRMLLMCKTPPCLAVISVGEDPASQVYIRNKKKACEEMGLRFEDCHFPANVTLKELATTIRRLNKDKTVNGIILQLPLPDHLREYEDHLLEWIAPSKDVDGLTSLNQGRLVKDGYGLGFTPCTPFGICTLLGEYGMHNLSGKHVVIVGRSKLVGKPMIQLMLQRNATVTVCHSQTADLASFTRQADILIVAVGKPKLITADMVKPGAVVVDVGINRVDGKLCGDVDFDSVKEIASHISPVPGGVGATTVAALIQNTIYAAIQQKGVAYEFETV